jgi:hypothetical protein
VNPVNEFDLRIERGEATFWSRRAAELERDVGLLACMALTANEPAMGIVDANVLADAVAVRVTELLADAAVAGEPRESRLGRTRVTEGAILSDVAVLERVARRLRRFVRSLVNRSVEVVAEPTPPRIDDPTRALARHLLARSGFVRVDR